MPDSLENGQDKVLAYLYVVSWYSSKQGSFPQKIVLNYVSCATTNKNKILNIKWGFEIEIMQFNKLKL